jgi:hypothetical protein
MKKTSRQRTPTRFVIPAIVLIMVVMLACAVWNTSMFDVGWIIGTFLAAAFITFLIIAPHLLPIEDSTSERWGAYRAFEKFLLGQNYPIALVRDGEVEAQGTLRGNKAGLGSNHGLIIADSTSVVALRTSTGISRVEGAYLDEQGRAHSGVVFTLPEEEIDTVIDLRPQIRRKPTTAQTRDGITVDVVLIAFFTPKYTRARKMNELHQLKHYRRPHVPFPPPYVWRRASMIQALSTRRIEPDGEQTRKTDWHDRIMEIAIPRLRDLISEYTVDELSAWNTTDKFPKHPRYVLRDELVKLVKQEMDANDEVHRPTGIEVRFMAVSSPMPPEGIIQRRIQAWSDEWRKKEADVLAQAEAEAILTRELARAQVQGEMTARISDILQEAKESQTDNTDLVMLRFLEAMEKMSKDPTTRTLLTLDALKMLNQLRDLLTPKSSEA